MELTSFQTGILILGGDFNIALEDTGTSLMPYRALHQIKIQLHNLLLHNTWHTLHPGEKDFTFYSTPHNHSSRIDYLWLTQEDLSLLTKAAIEPMFLTDHHPISNSLKFPKTPHPAKTCHLDKPLLTDHNIISSITKKKSEFFLNNTPDTNPITQWEAHITNRYSHNSQMKQTFQNQTKSPI